MDKLAVPSLLHPALSPIMLPLLGDSCTAELLGPLTQWTSPCISLAFSKGLGLGIVAAGAIVKVPQILKLLHGWDARGLSYSGFLLESVASGIFVAYNAANGYPWSTWGETAFIVLQNLCILVLMAAIQRRTQLQALLIAGFAVAGAGLYSAPLATLKMLQSTAMPISMASKLPPIYTVWKEGGSGALSAVTVVAYFAGSLARIFTTVKEVDDKLILTSYVINGVLNAVLLGQVLWYWNAKPKTGKANKKSKVE
ncbi:polyketide synthase [Catenaria anguillulae PL171]|uniref:Mannose-P-dolichol utilization defect 1 protein homolog n=1 Tax=Catenaria anguillulae PL171 TaxID=765915 RepID=A0A1Y2HS37_9FUNG|nr:polyketide synthase [Catenaria anguillulae PL171]